MRFSKSLSAALIVLAVPSAALAQQCGGDFESWRAGVRAEAESLGVGPAGIAALDKASLDPTVIEHDRAQAVFTQSFREFAGRMINDYRLSNGRQNLERYADTFAEAESTFGVPGPVIASFWALETDFGAVQGDFSTLDALASLAHDCRRPELFRPELIALLRLIDEGTVSADVTGAWAGEIGQLQMLPTDYHSLGVDGNGDGRVDLKGSAEDAILTGAAKISSLGWRPGEPWLDEVSVPDDLPWVEAGRDNKIPRSEWARLGVTRPDGSPLPADELLAGLVLPMGHRGPAFLAYENFDIYLEWNKSLVYTLTAAHLAARLAGAPPFDPGSPEPGLSAEEVKLLQRKLSDLGHDVGGIDGILGYNTREAIRQEQMRLGLPADGWPTQALLAQL